VTTPAPPTGRLPAGAFAALLLLALALRLAFVFMVPPVIQFPDGREYVEVARSLLAGHGFGLQTLRPPGYPVFIAAVWSITGESLLALRVAEALLGTLTAVLVGVFGARWFGRRAGLLAMAIATLHPVLAFLPATQYSENLIVLVCVLAYGCMLGALADARAGLGRWMAGGALLGLAALIRPNAVILAPGILLGATWPMARAGRRWLLPAVTVAAALALTLSPWLIRNHDVHDHWFFVATGGGRALWLGSNDHTTGRAGSIVLPDSTLTAELMRLPDEVGRDRRLGALGLAWMKADPARAARMYLVRMSSLWAIYPDTYTRTRFMNDFARVAQGAASVFIFAGALLALARARDVPLLTPMVSAIVLFSLVNAVFFMVLRYRMPFEPLLIWMAALGWTRVTAPRASGGV